MVFSMNRKFIGFRQVFAKSSTWHLRSEDNVVLNNIVVRNVVLNDTFHLMVVKGCELLVGFNMCWRTSMSVIGVLLQRAKMIHGCLLKPDSWLIH